MNLLITGSSGFIGRNLCLHLKKQKIKFTPIIRKSTNKDFFIKNKINYYEFDGDVKDLNLKMKNEKYTGILHLASLYINNHTEKDLVELVDSNILFGLKILESTINTDVSWFINTGTFWQHYNGEEYNPVNLYAATKQSFECLAKYYVETSDMKFVTLKLSDTYGDDDKRKKIYSIWSKISKSGETLKMSPGNQIIDISHVSDVVRAYLKLIFMIQKNEVENYDSFYLSSKTRMSLRDLSKKFENDNNVSLNIQWGELPYKKREVMNPICIGKKIII